jgi:hypothetical protein
VRCPSFYRAADFEPPQINAVAAGRMPQKNGALKTSAPFCFSLSGPFCRHGSSNLLKHPQAEEAVAGGQIQVDRLQQIRGDWHVGHAPLIRHLGCLQNIHHDYHLVRC